MAKKKKTAPKKTQKKGSKARKGLKAGIKKQEEREGGGPLRNSIVRLGKIPTLFPQHLAPGEQNADPGPIATGQLLVRVLAGRSAVFS